MKRATHRGNLVILAGAGVSAPSGLPLFDELRDGLLRGALPEFRADIQTPERDQTPERVFYTAAAGRRARLAVVQYVMCALGAGKPNWNHGALASVLRTGATVWTPNFDVLVEAAAPEGLRKSTRIRGIDKPAGDLQGLLLKPHGSIRLNKGPQAQRLIFTSTEVAAPLPPAWADAFHRSLDCADLLVWGYRGRDADIMPLLLAAARSCRTITWLTAGEAERASVLERFDSIPVTAPRFSSADPFGQMRRFIETEVLLARGITVDTTNVAPDVPRPVARRRATALVGPKLPASASANLADNVIGSAFAREILRVGLLRESNKLELLGRLARSLYLDVPIWRPLIGPPVRALMRSPIGSHSSRVQMLWLVTLDADGPTRSDLPPLRRVGRRSHRANRTRRAATGWQAFNLVRSATMLRALGEYALSGLLDTGRAERTYRAMASWHPSLVGNVLFDICQAARLTGNVTMWLSALERYEMTWKPFIPDRWVSLLEIERAYRYLYENKFSHAIAVVTEALESEGFDRRSGSQADLRLAGRVLRLASESSPARVAGDEELDMSVATSLRSCQDILIRGESARVDGDHQSAHNLFSAASASPSTYHRVLSEIGLAMLQHPTTQDDLSAVQRHLSDTGAVVWFVDRHTSQMPEVRFTNSVRDVILAGNVSILPVC